MNRRKRIYIYIFNLIENLAKIKQMINQLLICRTLISQNTLVYQRIYSRHISYLYFNSLYLKLLVSQNKLSGIRKDTLKYKLSEMNFDFEISRVDCISKENYFSHFSTKSTSQSLEHLPLPPHFFSKNTLSVRSTPMHLFYKNRSTGINTFEG